MSNTSRDGGSRRPAAAVARDHSSTDFSFEQIVKNRTLPPCSLSHFMDYLVYVEKRAENLQFFLWYADYVEKWSRLLPRQKLLSPAWDPTKTKGLPSRLTISVHKRSESEKLSKILTIMERGSPAAAGEGQKVDGGSSIVPQSPVVESPCGVETPHDWQPYTIQPFRDEVTKAIRHYISESSPRQLDLFPQERNACLHSTQQTTHPSALLPAFLSVDSVLRTESYPRFIKWTLSNANRPRLVFIQVVASLVVAAGLAMDLALVLSRADHFIRIACLALWWPGLTALIAACSGVCVVSHLRGVRALRPWEQFPDSETATTTAAAAAATAITSTTTITITTANTDETTTTRSSASFSQADDMEKGRVSTDSARRATFSRMDPLRKASLQAFGAKNDFQHESWVERHAALPLHRKILEPTMATRNTTVRMMQDRVVFGSVVWAGAISTVLTVASIFIPSANLF